MTSEEKLTNLPRCAGAVVRDTSGRVLLVLRANEPSRGMWSIPGGRIEPGESARAAAVREVREETGLDVEVGELLYAAEIGPYYIEDFAAVLVGGTLAAGDDALDARFFTLDEVRALPLASSLREALTLLGL